MDTPQISAPSRAPSRVPGRVTAFGVVHVHAIHTERFTIVGNHLAQHGELSLTAIGLAVHIQSLPDGAKVGIKTLSARFPESEARIAAALRELETHSYLRRFKERIPGGAVVTRTISYARPETVHESGPPQPVRPAEPIEPVAPGPVPSPVDPEPEPEPVPVPAPVESGPLPVPVPAAADPAPAPPPEPEAPRAGPPSAPPAPLPEPVAYDPDRLRVASGLLCALRRDDARLLLSEHEVRRLTPAVAAWLEREAGPDAVRLALTTGLPAALRRPAGLLAHRLATLAPPPLPAPAPPPLPMRNCDGCERGIRAPEGERCRDCRGTAARAA
ncbi:helix-turn-helix domain-containing protein [Streptomyces genisteinicus]|uniref:Helix-turn-helix domain-containing protein n=1 Tax=Streptomyces genisteinicus TaxID=2768068 RepID=A0A7H0HWE1_9ACTN|nr:helix-turn-helix domain-containing protein [Streptomyces genisteinicus]QNP64857.1 helix-turn-helix domain-containing protein [Streptomyces genisteinicus]